MANYVCQRKKPTKPAKDHSAAYAALLYVPSPEPPRSPDLKELTPAPAAQDAPAVLPRPPNMPQDLQPRDLDIEFWLVSNEDFSGSESVNGDDDQLSTLRGGASGPDCLADRIFGS